MLHHICTSISASNSGFNLRTIIKLSLLDIPSDAISLNDMWQTKRFKASLKSAILSSNCENVADTVVLAKQAMTTMLSHQSYNQ